MALELPDWLTDAFNLIGLPWPGVDEDQLRDWATSVRQFADDICDNSSQTNQTMRELADSSQSSVLRTAAGQYERHHQLLVDLHGPMNDFAEALDVVADAVVVQKGAVIAAAGVLAAALVATQAEALFTFGLAEAEVPVEVAVAKTAVRFALQELESVVMGRLINWGAGQLSDVLGRSITTLASDAWGVTMEVQGLKVAYEQVHGAAEKMRGHADRAEELGSRAHSENTGRKLEDSSGGGGWSEVINAIKQMLLDMAGDLFTGLPRAIASVLRDIVGVLERLASRLKGADEEGGPAVTVGAKGALPKVGATPGAEHTPAGADGKKPDLAEGDGKPGTDKPPRKCTGNGDPVDVATGDVMLTETDVTLPGVLPLVLERTHRSSRRTGRWFGRSWMSSLDQRLLITGGRIYAGFADGEILTWTPPDSVGGPPAVPATGPICPLRLNPDGSYTVSDPQRGLTWRFEHRAGYEPPEGSEAELPLVSVTDRIGHEITFNYDAAGRPLSVVHSGGYRVLVTVTDEHVTALTLAGRDGGDDIPLRQFEYDAAGNLSGVINSSGLPMRFTYDDAGRMTSWTDRNGHSYRYTFDADGRCVRGDGPGGALSGTFTYEPGLTRWTDAAGAATTYELTGSAEVAAITDPLGNVTRWERDLRDRITTQIDSLGRITRYAYDDRGNLIAITRPDGSQASADYDDQCLPVLLTGPDGAGWRQEHDGHGNRTLLEAPDGTVTRFGYDDHGHLATVTAPDGAVTVVACDTTGLPVEVTGPDGARTVYETGETGQVVRIAGPDGGAISLDWTPDGKPASRTFPDGTAETWEWDGEGNLTRHVSTAGAVTSYGYGPFDKITDVRWPDGGRTEFAYDQGMRLTSVTHGGLTWRYEYDPAGRLARETDYNGAATVYEHDAAGQLTRQVNAVGQEITFGYGLLGDLAGRTAGGTVTTYGYDEAGRMTRARNTDADLRFERDALGRVTAETCNGRTVITSYDPAGRTVGRVTPSGETTGWEFDEAGHPAIVTSGGHQMRFGYDAAGRETRRDLPGGISLAQEWDQRGRLTVQSLAGQGRELQRRDYRYRADGFPDRIDDLLAGSRALTLDPSGRITSVTGPDWAEQYAYDQAGTITAAAFPSPPAGATAAWPGARGPGSGHETAGTLITRAGNIRYRHDAAGRVVARTRTRISRKPETWRYEWDADSRLTAVTTPDGTRWHYRYDPFGRRIAKQQVSTDGRMLSETRFIWDGPVLAEQAETTGDREQVTTWDYQPGTCTPIAQTEYASLRDVSQEAIDRRFYAIITDLSGMPAELTSPDGTLAGRQQHTLWGATAWNPGGASTPLRFPGQYEDPETGLHYNNQRYYDPVTATYLTPDPLGLSPSPNPHGYVPNPHVETDPLGLASCKGLSSSNSAEENQAAIDARDPGKGFSGIYDPETGKFEAEPSGPQDDPTRVVPRRGGHGVLNKQYFGDSRKTVGFAAVKQEDGSLNMSWLSRGVTGRNYPGSNGYASAEHQAAISKALEEATGRTVRTVTE